MSKLPQSPPLLTDDPIRLWVPLEIEPNRDSLFKSAAELPDSVIVKGLVSSDRRDLDGELIRQDGIDWSWFLTPGQGALTFGHTQWKLRGPIIGRPRQVRPAKLEDGTAATWLEGNLWLRTDYGMQVYRDHQAALAAGDPGMGFSIEGTALERDPLDPSIVLRCIVYNVAIAFQQKNDVASMDPFQAAMSSFAKAVGADEAGSIKGPVMALAQALRSLLGMGDAPFLSPMSAPTTTPSRKHGARDALLKGVSDDELRALRILRKNPALPFADAAREVAWHKHQQGIDR